MNTTELLSGIVLGIVFSMGSICSAQSTKPVKEEILFTKEISLGQKIVITREPVDVKQLGILGADLAGREVAVATVRVELQIGDGQRIILGSSIHSEYDDFRKGFAILDVFTGEMEVVIACTMGSDVGLWRISLDQFRPARDGWVRTPPDGRAAERIPLEPGTLTVAMTKKPGHRWGLTITDHRVKPKPLTVTFEQIENAWAFKQVDPPGFGK